MFYEGNKDMREFFGGKGVNFVEMINFGFFVFFGFIVIIEVCIRYYEEGEKIVDEIVEEIFEKFVEFEKIMGKKFGDLSNLFFVFV